MNTSKYSVIVSKWKWKSLSHVQLCDQMDYTARGILQAKFEIMCDFRGMKNHTRNIKMQ